MCYLNPPLEEFHNENWNWISASMNESGRKRRCCIPGLGALHQILLQRKSLLVTETCLLSLCPSYLTDSFTHVRWNSPWLVFILDRFKLDWLLLPVHWNYSYCSGPSLAGSVTDILHTRPRKKSRSFSKARRQAWPHKDRYHPNKPTWTEQLKVLTWISGDGKTRSLAKWAKVRFSLLLLRS